MKRLALFLVIVTALSPVLGARAEGPQLVGEDATGDWGIDFTGDNSLAPVAAATGQDLTSASLDNSTPGVVKFVIGVAGLPANGGVPEAVRYIWIMKADGQHMEIDGKFTNYSRGVCDPTSGQCPPPRDPGAQPFFVRGSCTTVGGQVGTCEEVGLVQATFDPATSTITVPVPISMLSKKDCAEIVPDSDDASFPGGNSVISIPSAYYSDATVTIYDQMMLNEDMDVTVC
jgi:hypothetical protein